MKFHLLTVFIIVLVFLNLSPVQAQIEDLKRTFYLETGEDQIKTGLRICDSLQEEESGLLAFSIKLLEIAGKAGTKGMLLARVEKAVADGFFYSDSLVSSNEHLLRAIAIAESADPADSLFLAELYNDLGLNYIDIGETTLAADYLNRSIQIFRNANKPDDLANALSNLATLHYTKGQHGEAISLYNEVYQIDLKTGNKKTNQSP